MAFLFYTLGWLVFILGGAIFGLSLDPLAAALRAPDPVDNARLVTLLFSGPGLGVMFCGLLLLAIGGILSRLDRIGKLTKLLVQQNDYPAEPGVRRKAPAEPALAADLRNIEPRF